MPTIAPSTVSVESDENAKIEDFDEDELLNCSDPVGICVDDLNEDELLGEDDLWDAATAADPLEEPLKAPVAPAVPQTTQTEAIEPATEAPEAKVESKKAESPPPRRQRTRIEAPPPEISSSERPARQTREEPKRKRAESVGIPKIAKSLRSRRPNGQKAIKPRGGGAQSSGRIKKRPVEPQSQAVASTQSTEAKAKMLKRAQRFGLAVDPKTGRRLN